MEDKQASDVYADIDAIVLEDDGASHAEVT
jgi:hypothetical protein